MAKSKDLSERSEFTVAEKEVDDTILALLSGEISFDDATERSDRTTGGILLTGDAVSQLIRIPFAIIGGTFRVANERFVADEKVNGDYVSLECVISDERKMRASGIDLSTLSFGPLDVVRFNNGSTGVRRQMVRYLAMKEYIKVQSDKTPLVESGALGESSYDIPFHMWESFNIGTLREEGEEPVWDFKIPRLFVASRGLRASTYEVNKKDVTTFYLA